MVAWCRAVLWLDFRRGFHSNISQGGDMSIEISSRKEDRRKAISSFVEKEKRKEERRGAVQRKIDKKKRKEFERHINAQR